MLSILKSSKNMFGTVSHKLFFQFQTLNSKSKSGLLLSFLNKQNFSNEISWNIPKFEEHPNRSYQKLGYGLSLAILGYLCFSINDVFNKNNEVILLENQPKERIKLSYAYLLSSLCITSISSIFLFNTKLLAFNLRLKPLTYLMIYLPLTFLTLIPTMVYDYKTQTKEKHISWVAFNIVMAGNLISIGLYGGPLIAQAVLATGCLVGGLSIVGMKITDETAIYLRPILGIGIGVITGATLGYLFFPMPFLYNISLYGGLVVFSGTTITDTNLLIAKAKNEKEFDPLGESISLYLDVLLIFIRIVQLLNNDEKKKN